MLRAITNSNVNVSPHKGADLWKLDDFLGKGENYGFVTDTHIYRICVYKTIHIYLWMFSAHSPDQYNTCSISLIAYRLQSGPFGNS
jgi:hypothetical protein